MDKLEQEQTDLANAQQRVLDAIERCREMGHNDRADALQSQYNRANSRREQALVALHDMAACQVKINEYLR